MTNPKKMNWGFFMLLITQFLGAFNDNVFKLIISFLIVDHFATEQKGALWLSLSGIVFILPFLLFSTYAGFLADRVSKKRIMVCVKVIEVVIMALALFALTTGGIYGVFMILFLLGTHSAFFSPAKYGILPEILSEEELSEGNGAMEMWTYLAIILGQACGGILIHVYGQSIEKVIYILMGISVLGVVASLFLPVVKPAGSPRTFQWNFLKEVWQNTKYIKADRTIFLSMVGLVYFGFLGGLFQLNIILYARQLMEIDHLQSSSLLIALGIGIGTGSVLAGKLSDQKVELGLVPLGSIGLSLFSILLGIAYHSYPFVLFCLFLLGISSGFYIVPLNTLIQQNSPADRRGQILSTNNFFAFFAILTGSGILYVFRDILHFNPAMIFVICGILTIAGTIYVCRLLPYALVRFIVWMLAHTVYKIKVVNRQKVPSQGGALLVSNHVSFVDAVLIVVTLQRPVRFLMNREIYHLKWLTPICRLAKAIPINRKDNPKEIIRALRIAQEAVKSGELVCIFPEGQLTRTGNMLKFNQGFEHIMKGVEAPVIPIHLDRIWGSIFSWEGGRFLGKWPKILPYPVTISFGNPQPSTTTAFEIRTKVQELGAEAFQYRLADRITLPEAFFKEMRAHPSRFCIADSSGKKLNYAMTWIASLICSDLLKLKLGSEENVGILIPPSVGGVMANIAVGILNKVPVNINYTASKEAVASIVQQCGMRYCITSRQVVEKLGINLPCELIYIEDIIKSFFWENKIKAFLQSFLWPEWLAHRAIFGQYRNRSHQELATIMFTSGSTGNPKGVLLTHSNIISNLEGLYQAFAVKEDDKILGILPFFHSFGFTGTMWFPLISGMGAVYHSNPLDAKVIGKLVQEYQTTLLMSTPTFLNSYIRRCEAQQFKSLRLIMVGAEKLKPGLTKEFKEKFGIEPMEGYGCTELSPIVALNLPDVEAETIRQKAQKSGTIGLPLPGIAVNVIDQSNMTPLGPNTSGLFVVKGPNVMKGYLNQPEKTSEVIRDGWYLTGDIAQIDEDGFITITDRLSRFSKIAGEMVAHIKIEEKIHELLGSAEQLCIVTSLPDDKRGEKLVVLCLPQVDVATLTEQLKKSDLPNLWVPDKEMYFRIESLPLLGTGKLDLSGIKKRAGELVGAFKS